MTVDKRPPSKKAIPPSNLQFHNGERETRAVARVCAPSNYLRRRGGVIATGGPRNKKSTQDLLGSDSVHLLCGAFA